MDGGLEVVPNQETVKYQLSVFVTKDDGESINLYLELMGYDDATEGSWVDSFEFQTVHRSRSDQRIACNKILQSVPVEVINVNRLILTWNYDVMEHFPLEICGFEALQELRIASSKGNVKHPDFCLRHLPPEIGDMQFLRVLEISACRFLRDLPSEIGNLENLEELVISYCESLLHLPSEIGDLKTLRRLKISECFNLEDLPSTIGNLESLEELSVNSCHRLTRFPSETSNLKRLRKMNITAIDTSWNGTDNFRLECSNLVNLQEMRIVYCGSLVDLPPEIGNLRCLQKLLIEKCYRLENLPSEIGNLESLQEMIITNCPRVLNLPPEIGNLRCLRKLEITHSYPNKKITRIPLEVGNLLSLQEFGISCEGCLEHLVIVINKLERQLQQLNIDYGKRYDPSYEHHPVPSSAGIVVFDVNFTMTLEELYLDVCANGTVSNVENSINFLQSLAAENSPSSPISLLLPQGIRYIDVHFPWVRIARQQIPQETICKLLRKYPRLGKIRVFQKKDLNHFSADILHLMYYNRFGRSLQNEASKSGDRTPPTRLAENVWPIILEEAQTRIQKDFTRIPEHTNLKNPTTIGASVIYSIVQELLLPLLVEL